MEREAPGCGKQEPGMTRLDDKARELMHRTEQVTRRRFIPSSAKKTGLKDIEILLGMRLFLVLRCLLCFLF
jgi:hypothetical protein